MMATESPLSCTCNACGERWHQAAAPHRCPLCGERGRVTSEPGTLDAPEQVLPFEVDRAAAWQAILDHMGATDWAHPDLCTAHTPVALTRVWVPAWVFRGSYEGQYGATSVMKYILTHTSNVIIEKKVGTREEAHPVTGPLKNAFAVAGVIADATPLGRFVAPAADALARMRPVTPQDLDDAVVLSAGPAESDPAAVWKRTGEARMREHVVDSVKAIVSGDEVRNVRVQVDATWAAARAWVPAWRYEWRYGGATHAWLVDGRRVNGGVRIAGEVPLDEAEKARSAAPSLAQVGKEVGLWFLGFFFLAFLFEKRDALFGLSRSQVEGLSDVTVVVYMLAGIARLWRSGNKRAKRHGLHKAARADDREAARTRPVPA